VTTLLFAYLRTGGGHLAPARALAGYIGREYADRARPVLMDALEGGSAFARWMLEDGYRILQAYGRRYYEFLYLTNKIPLIAAMNERLVAPFVRERLRAQILSGRPDHIVIFHFLLIRPVMQILGELRLTTPVTVVVTDPYTAHPLWFRDHRPRFILFSEQLRAHCERTGIPAGSMTVHPFVLAERFSVPAAPGASDALRTRLGLPSGRKLVLVLGGADGIPRGGTILRRLALQVPGAAVAMVCGKNTVLLRNAERIREQSGRGDITLYGYVDFAWELINAADIVISKCGASTFMEILLSGKIPVITDYLWEQEKGNKDFLERTGTGFFEPHLHRLPRLINRLLDDEALCEEVRSRARALGLRNGTPEVARQLVETPS
jgi:UDP-N-acetylglucosamine:LPS N-acetylglucosamine transferase